MRSHVYACIVYVYITKHISSARHSRRRSRISRFICPSSSVAAAVKEIIYRAVRASTSALGRPRAKDWPVLRQKGWYPGVMTKRRVLLRHRGIAVKPTTRVNVHLVGINYGTISKRVRERIEIMIFVFFFVSTHNHSDQR